MGTSLGPSEGSHQPDRPLTFQVARDGARHKWSAAVCGRCFAEPLRTAGRQRALVSGHCHDTGSGRLDGGGSVSTNQHDTLQSPPDCPHTSRHQLLTWQCRRVSLPCRPTSSLYRTFLWPGHGPTVRRKAFHMRRRLLHKIVIQDVSPGLRNSTPVSNDGLTIFRDRSLVRSLD